MNHTKKFIQVAVVMLMAVALLLCGCGKANKPIDAMRTGVEVVEVLPTSTPIALAQPLSVDIPATENEMTGAENEIIVSTVDEFLAAIGSNRTIYMEGGGSYDLTQASDYGREAKSDCYAWREINDGYELVIHDIEGLQIIGHHAKTVSIRTTPRYANVITFENCSKVLVKGITAGHSDGAGTCAGAVLHFDSVKYAEVYDSILFGCGTRGVEAVACENVTVENCKITDCSLGAILIERSRNANVRDCRMTDCGTEAMQAYSLLSIIQSDAVSVVNCSMTNNVCQRLLESRYSNGTTLLTNEIKGNQFIEMVLAEQFSPIIAGCAFSDNETAAWYASQTDTGAATVQAVSQSGSLLSEDDLKQMQLSEVPYVSAPSPTETAQPPSDGEMREVSVSTVDEFLAAIAPNTTVRLAEGIYDLSKASNYGGFGTDWYYWYDVYDGPGLFITGVSNFHVIGSGTDKTSIHAIPRYADVITFEKCENASVSGVTLGHSEAPGECSGGVLRVRQSKGIAVKDCGLFGCGILGMYAEESEDIAVENTEIYDCSEGAGRFYECKNVRFTNCNIHDCGKPLFAGSGLKEVLVDGKPCDQEVQ